MRGREKEIWEGGESNLGMLAVQALTALTWMYTCIHGINLVYELASKVQSQHWHSSLARDYMLACPWAKPLSYFNIASRSRHYNQSSTEHIHIYPVCTLSNLQTHTCTFVCIHGIMDSLSAPDLDQEDMTCRAMAKTQMGLRKWERRNREGVRGTDKSDQIHHVSGATSRIVPLCCAYGVTLLATTCTATSTAYYTYCLHIAIFFNLTPF